jgi:hypothetical protein
MRGKREYKFPSSITPVETYALPETMLKSLGVIGMV